MNLTEIIEDIQECAFVLDSRPNRLWAETVAAILESTAAKLREQIATDADPLAGHPELPLETAPTPTTAQP